MTREELEEVFFIETEIKQLEERIKKIEKQSEIVSDVVQNGYNRRATVTGYDIKRQYKLDAGYDKLIKFKKKLEEKHKEIEDYIERIPFSEIRQIFRYRYLDKMNWYQIQIKMEYGHEDTARKKHNRYLEKN